MTERILCSAIYVCDDKRYVHQPKNIDFGFVVCGRRHHNCFSILKIITDLKRPEFVEISSGVFVVKKNKNKVTQGFLTSEDRFVTRSAAFLIAYHAQQIIRPVPENQLHKVTELFSEDLY